MLQFNHVTISGGSRGERGHDRILSDFTFRFEEGKVYVITGESKDIITIFNCIASEKKTDEGEIVTWEGVRIYNSPDDTLLPERLTGEDYLESLKKMWESRYSAEEMAELLGIEYYVLKSCIGTLDEHIKAKLRFAAMLMIDPYIVTFKEPFSLTYEMLDVFKKFREEKIIIFGTDSDLAAQKLSEETEAVMLRISSGKLI